MSNIPRKLSIDDMARDPCLRAIGAQLDVLVDGQPQDRVTRYDMDAGEGERYATWPDGGLKTRYRKGSSEVVTEVIRGVVEVRHR